MSTSTTITGLTALGVAPASTDVLVMVDVSDPTQDATGTTKQMLVANLFSGPSITAPSMTTVTITSGGLNIVAGGATITGNSTITGTLTVSSSATITGGTIALGSVSGAGQVRATDDGGTQRWLAGILSAGGARDYSIYDLTGAGARVTVSSSDGSVAIATKFGCNGATPQAKATIGAASTDLASVITLANNIRTALNANGITQT